MYATSSDAVKVSIVETMLVKVADADGSFGGFTSSLSRQAIPQRNSSYTFCELCLYSHEMVLVDLTSTTRMPLTCLPWSISRSVGAPPDS